MTKMLIRKMPSKGLSEDTKRCQEEMAVIKAANLLLIETEMDRRRQGLDELTRVLTHNYRGNIEGMP